MQGAARGCCQQAGYPTGEGPCTLPSLYSCAPLQHLAPDVSLEIARGEAIEGGIGTTQSSCSCREGEDDLCHWLLKALIPVFLQSRLAKELEEATARMKEALDKPAAAQLPPEAKQQFMELLKCYDEESRAQGAVGNISGLIKVSRLFLHHCHEKG